MSIKISELPQATNVGSNDFVPIVQNGETKKALASDFGGGGGGTSDYTDLTNKPSINSVTLTGDKTSGDLNLVGTGDIATTIDSTSTNSEVAGAKAVYDATLDNYSTTEQVVGTWVDGKPLYEKTYSVTAPVVTTSGNWASSKYAMPANFDYAFVNMAVIKDTASQYLQTPFITISGYLIKCYIGVDNGSWVIVSSNYSGVSNCTGYVTIRYTKTTDTATNSLNASLMNTGSLVGMGDRAELTGNVTDNPSGDTI